MHAFELIYVGSISLNSICAIVRYMIPTFWDERLDRAVDVVPQGSIESLTDLERRI